MESTSPHPTTHHGAFGNDRFGVIAERFARFFGTPRFIVGQTIVVAIWIAINAVAIGLAWDPYPFILLNLAFSTQAAYAAPLILLAQTRQADRDKVMDASVQKHRERESQRSIDAEKRQTDLLDHERHVAEQQRQLLAENTRLTQEVLHLTKQLQATVEGRSAT